MLSNAHKIARMSSTVLWVPLYTNFEVPEGRAGVCRQTVQEFILIHQEQQGMVGSIQYTCTVYTAWYGTVYAVYMYSVHKEYGRVLQYTCSVYSEGYGRVYTVYYTCTLYTEGYGRVFTVDMYIVHSRVR